MSAMSGSPTRAAGPTKVTAGGDTTVAGQMNRLQYVQYECIKTELKEEYEKRVNFLHKRIEKRQAQQGPYQDAHLILMQNSMGDPSQSNQQGKKEAARGKYNSNTGRPGSPIRAGGNQTNSASFFLPGMSNQQKNAQRKADRQLKLGIMSQSAGGGKQDGVGFPNRRSKNFES
jgi:hypothetical protein